MAGTQSKDRRRIGSLRRRIGWCLVASLLVLSFALALGVERVDPPDATSAVEAGSRDVRQLWSAAQPAVRTARELAVGGDTDAAVAALDAEIATRMASERAVRALERERLEFERAVLLDNVKAVRRAWQNFPNLLTDARTDGDRTALPPDAVARGLLEEAPDAAADSPYVRFVVASADPELPLVVDAFGESGLAEPEALVAALAAFEQTPPGTTATDGLRGMLGDDWWTLAHAFERIARDDNRSNSERALASWCLREVSDLPVALAPRWYMYKRTLNGFVPARVLDAWAPVRELRGDAAFLARLDLAIDELERSFPNSGPVKPSRLRTRAVVAWLDGHVGPTWRSEQLVRTDVERLRTLVASLASTGLREGLAELAGVSSDASPASLVERMTERSDDIGILDQLLRSRVPDGVVPPLRCASQLVQPLSIAWHEVLGPPKVRRGVHAVWLDADGAEWRVRGRFDTVLAEGSGADVELAELRAWERRSDRAHRIPGTPIRRRERLSDRLTCRLELSRDAHGVRLLASRVRIGSQHFKIDRRRFPDGRVADVPRLLPARGPRPLSDTCLLVWMDADAAGSEGVDSESWRDAVARALQELSESPPMNLHRRREAYLSALDVAARIPMPEARDALHRLARQDEPFQAASDLLIYALVLAGDEELLLDPTRSALAEGNRLAHLSQALDTADPMFWAQVLIRTASPRVRSISTGHLTSLAVAGDRALARVLLTAEDARPGTVPHVLLGPARLSGEDVGGLSSRQTRSVIISLLLLVGCGLALRRVRRIVRAGGEAPRSALALLVVGVAFAITDFDIGPVDVFPDAGGYLIAAGALTLLGAPVKSHGARVGAWAFVAAAGLSLVADLATILDVGWYVLDVLAAIACAVGVVTLAPLAADLLRDLGEPREAHPRAARLVGRWRILATAIGLALLGMFVPTVLVSILALQASGPASLSLGLVVLAWLSIVAALTAWMVWRAGLRRGSDVMPLPPLFVLGFGADVAVRVGLALGGGAEDGLDPLPVETAALGVIGVTALVWCGLRLVDSVRIRRRALTAPGRA